MDKKRVSNSMNYVLLERIGKGVIQQLPLDGLESRIRALSNEGKPLKLLSKNQ
jgi:3-dehydroquinate synthase